MTDTYRVRPAVADDMTAIIGLIDSAGRDRRGGWPHGLTATCD